MVINDNAILQRLWVDNPAYISAIKRDAPNRFIKPKLPVYTELKWGYGDIPQAVSAFYEHLSVCNKAQPIPATIPNIQWQLKPEQLEVSDKLLKHRYAYGHISTGVGKTWILCYLAWSLQQKTLIILDWVSALKQFEASIQNIFWIKAYKVGAKKGSESPIHLINIQSLKKVDKKAYGLVLYDEADKFLSSENYRKELCSLQSYYSYAVTGTVKLNGYPDNMFPMFYGKKEELILKYMKPEYIQLSTWFNIKSVDKFSDKDTPINFSEIETLLYNNDERNEIITILIDKLMKSHNKAIVFSKRVEHAKTLKAMLEAKGHKVFMLIGEVKGEEREKIRQEIIDYPGKCILVGSVKIIGRWFDVPALDLWVLTTAETFSSNIEQYIGRIIRLSPGKTKATFVDICDKKHGILLSQSKKRYKAFINSF